MTAKRPALLSPLLAALAAIAAPMAAAPFAVAVPAPPTAVPVLRPQTVAPLPGSLNRVAVVNDNNPELIREPGILLSSFDGLRGWAGRPLGDPAAHLDRPLSGRFELFSHHVYAGRPESLDSTLWLAVVAAPRGTRDVQLRLAAGSTSLSQSVDPAQPSAPFLPLPPLMSQTATAPVWSGPGSRVATELLRRERSPLLPRSWSLPAGRLTTLVTLPLPVRGLDPLLNGRNLQLHLDSDGAVDLATLAAFGPADRPPDEATWARLMNGGLSPKDHGPTPRGARGAIVYSRVSGIQLGSLWQGRLTDPGRPTLSVSRAPISWPIASLERGTLGTGQVQTAELSAFYPGTAWAAHGNYGVEYDLTLPLRNDTAAPVRLQIAFESPLKGDQPLGGLRFGVSSPQAPVLFRGTVEVTGLDDADGRAAGRLGFHLVSRAGQQGPALGTVSLAPAQERLLRVRLIYPADATPPQVLSLLPLPAAGGPSPAVKQSGAPPTARP